MAGLQGGKRSIVLISFINSARDRVAGGWKRFSRGQQEASIILTTVTTIGGLCPLPWDSWASPVWLPLATLIVFALSAASVLMLVVTLPILRHRGPTRLVTPACGALGAGLRGGKLSAIDRPPTAAESAPGLAPSPRRAGSARSPPARPHTDSTDSTITSREPTISSPLHLFRNVKRVEAGDPVVKSLNPRPNLDLVGDYSFCTRTIPQQKVNG